MNIFLGFIAASNISKCHLDLIFFNQLGFAFTKIHGAATGSALHSAHEVDPNADQQDHWQTGHQELREERRTFGRNHLDIDMVFKEIVDQVGIARVVG